MSVSKERRRELSKQYYWKNRDKILEGKKGYYRREIKGPMRRYYSEKYRDYYRKHTYGITPEEFAQMLLDQEGVCAICGCPPKEGKALVIDHDHTTGKVRGALCIGCNTRVGYLESDLFDATLEYLSKE
jgi:hypothetical protein